MAFVNFYVVHSVFGMLQAKVDADTSYSSMFFEQNHSCDPNCAMNASYIHEANLDKPLLALFTRRDVLPWEELSFSYNGYDSDEEVSNLCCCMLWPSLILV